MPRLFGENGYSSDWPGNGTLFSYLSLSMFEQMGELAVSRLSIFAEGDPFGATASRLTRTSDVNHHCRQFHDSVHGLLDYE